MPGSLRQMGHVYNFPALPATSGLPREGRGRLGPQGGASPGSGLLGFWAALASCLFSASPADGGLCSESELPSAGSPALLDQASSHGEVRWLRSGVSELANDRLATFAQSHLSRAGAENGV